MRTVSHGYGAYLHRRCRCRTCRRANATRHLASTLRREATAIPASVGHGKVSTYTNYRCRCDRCRLAWNAAMVAYRQMRKSSAAVETVL